jgi:predicted Zn-dependent protease
MAKAGYDTRAMLRVMEVLRSAGNGGLPEFFSTHPNPDQRIELIERAFMELYPNEVPSSLKP